MTSESCFSYSKPLIAYYLAEKIKLDDVYFKKQSFYITNKVNLRLKSEVKQIDLENRAVVVGDNKIYFNKLLIASGGKPIIPKIGIVRGNSEKLGNLQEPGNAFIGPTNYKSIDGVFTLNTLEDVVELRNYIKENEIKKVSILGGGLIGSKAVEAFLEIGLKINIIELSDRILSASLDRKASGIIENKIKSMGSNIFTENTVGKIYTEEQKITGLMLRDGRKVDCNLLVLAIGVKPNLDFLSNSKIKLNKGIVVDSYMQTTQNDIFAAGDVVDSLDIILEKDRNIAIWPLAVRQGAIAGANMAGEQREYSGGFFMNSVEILNIPSISMGLTNLQDEADKNFEVFKSFKPEENLYRKIVIKENKIIGVILVGNIERAGIYCGLIRNKINISNVKDNILMEDFGIIQLPEEYRKHLVVGNGIEV